MITLTTLYDDYIDRPKLTEKNPFEYIVPLPLKWVGTTKNPNAWIKSQKTQFKIEAKISQNRFPLRNTFSLKFFEKEVKTDLKQTDIKLKQAQIHFDVQFWMR